MLFDEINTGNIPKGIFTKNISDVAISAPKTRVAAYQPHNFLFHIPTPPAIITMGEMMFVRKNNGSRNSDPGSDNDSTSPESDRICKMVNIRKASPTTVKYAAHKVIPVDLPFIC